MKVHAETQTGSIPRPSFPDFLSLSHAFLLDSSSSIKNWSSIVFSTRRPEPSLFVNLPSSRRFLLPPLIVDCASIRILFSRFSECSLTWARFRSLPHTLFFLSRCIFISLSSYFFQNSNFSFCSLFLLCAPELFLVFLYPKLQH